MNLFSNIVAAVSDDLPEFDDDTTVNVRQVPGGKTYQGGMGGWITFVPDAGEE